MKIVDKAFEAMQNAYAPYSKYKVGACCLLYTSDAADEL